LNNSEWHGSCLEDCYMAHDARDTMQSFAIKASGAAAVLGWLTTMPVSAALLFSTGNPDGLMATASRPDTAVSPVPPNEIESADDFILSNETKITSATFTGLLPSGAPLGNVTSVVVEIYRVFPKDSANPPDGRVPTRVNSPSDVAFESRASADNTLNFSGTILSASFTAANSVLNGIHPLPNVTTGGEGAVTGEEVQFTVNFTSPFDLPADHYFFVPQVALSSGNFFWLSAANPIVGGTGPFTPDLQEWIRNSALEPDWLRVATDIVGTAPPVFNATFSLTGDVVVPEPGSLSLLGAALAGMGLLGWRCGRRGLSSARNLTPCSEA
jgi:hypothetical protein